MSDTRDDSPEGGLLMAALGHCILQWASVELQLALLFRALMGPPYEIADLLWGRIRSFDAKLLMLQDLAASKLTDEDVRRDWNLLRSHTALLYRKRNEVAHSTLIDGDSSPALEPFANVSQPADKLLRKPDLDVYASEFEKLSAALLHFNLEGRAASRHQQSPRPASDLLLRLRTEDDQRREAQRHRALAWRQYLERNPGLKGH